MELSFMGKIRQDQSGMIMIEILIILILVMVVMETGFKTYLAAYKESVQNIQKERLVYDGERLWTN